MQMQSLLEIAPLIGSTCLGIVVGWLVRYFIRRFKSHTPQVLGSIIGIVLGGAIIKFFGADQTAIWFYPIGLLLGFIMYSIQARLSGGDGDGVQYARKPDSDEE
ncbi:hypothetical protein [Nostoc sp. WHI]|uniref:hypothetical protein n=1 Tax=Nostoc sp. WHI TaxID=2650611 RepID=UPI0018C51C7E|nr:hypothetical protein [Nostoc sp. WHI]MBG1265488.1 hypothetical protein [Nostoc sp. WHI]